jgi:phosphoglycerate dehydrogenase-like enzyme
MMAAVNVLFIRKLSEILKQHFRTRLGDIHHLNLIFPEEETEEKYLELAPDAHVIVGWRPTKELLARAQKLKLYINPGTGVQHLLELFRDLDPARGVVLVNGHGHAYFVAQHVVALLLTLMNKVIPHHQKMVAGEWRQWSDAFAATIPLRDRHVGLLGYGAINRWVHRFLAGFELDFHLLRRSWRGKPEPPLPYTQKYTPNKLHAFLRKVDTLIVAVPQTEETTGILGQAELRLLGPEGVLVNVARGAVIDQEALYKALEEKAIAGAAIDVWYEYQPEPVDQGRRYPTDYPFHELDNAVLSPHRAASPFSDLKRWDEIIENIRRYAHGRTDFLNIVDLVRGY